MEMDLGSMKYSDLQALAKTVGLKANMKADKMLKALKQHFEQKETSENGNTVTSDDAQIPEEAGSEPKSTKDALVTTRRVKKQQAKRKYLGDGANLNPMQEESRVQEDAKSPGEGEEEEGEGKRSSKRRKVSSAKDTETPASEMKPACDEAIAEASNKDVVNKTAGKIPRHEGLMKKAALKPTTPNFKKLHEAHFNKMESIDSYVQRRNKQMEVFRNSVKDLKAQSENRVKIPADTKTRAKPLISRASLFSPGVPETKVEKRKVSRATASKPVKKDGAPFRPSVLSGNKINVRFSQTTQDNEHKRSLVKTPSRMSLRIPLTPTPGRKTEVHANKDAAPVNRTPGLTPFIFNGASGTPSTNKKSTFDLKASLSRPLTYKPHTGKLKPYGATQENAALNKSQTLPSHQKNYKQHRVQTRDERRVHHNEDRKQKKEKMLGARRGLVLA